ncbi:MAG TPA: S8 family peptidase [Herpetosiphonaceae bacterium]
MNLSFQRLALCLTLLGACLSMPNAFAADHAAAARPILPAQGPTLPNRYIVVLKDGSNPRSVAALSGVQPTHLYTSALTGFAAELNAGQLNALQHNPNVDYIEHDAAVTLDTTQNMDANGDPWGLDRIDQRNLPLSRTYTYTATGAGVTAYIIDTGIQANHPDFGGRGANVYDSFGGNGNDCNGHGTHVAGTVGGTTWGVAKSVNLRGVRVLDCGGSGSWSGVIAGVDWVRANAQKPAVANMSLGGGYNASVNTAVANLSNSGVFVAVAAGNNYSSNACNGSPSGTPEAYTVAASEKNDAKAVYSDVGSCVDIYAPGSAIKSAWLNSGTHTISGTSMATPHVAGVAALYKSVYGDAASATVSNWLSTNATPNVISGNPSGTVNRLLYVPPFGSPPTTGCPESSCLLIQNAYISHFTGLDCTGEEHYYTPYFNSDGIRRSWNGQGFAGNTLRTVTNRSWKDSSGVCRNDWPNGNTLSGFVRIYRDTQFTPVQAAYISHFTGLDCTGQESYYTPYFNSDGIRRSWDGRGSVGSIVYTATNKSWKDSSGACYNSWPNGNTLSGFVRVYR